MSCERRPWYPWYPKDFGQDEKVRCLPALAELVYRRALDLMWQSNRICLPNEIRLLAQSLGSGMSESEFDEVWKRIQYPDFELFKVSEDGKWVYSERLKREAAKIETIVNKRKIASEKGNKRRWGKDKKWDPNGIANGGHSDPHPDPDPDPDINPSGLGRSATADPPPQKKGKSVGGNGCKPLPAEFPITPSMQSWFKEQNFIFANIEKDTDAFCDYWKSRGKNMKNWEACWRNWMRKAEQYALGRNGGKPPPKPPSRPQWAITDPNDPRRFGGD